MPKMKSAPLPFHKDLNGSERVNRALARKLWSWGLPVRQDSGKGAVLLEKPAGVPAAGAKAGFDAACAAAAGKPYAPEARKCVYLIPWGRMALHLSFRDGSNPFVKYGTAEELLYELQAWSHRYRIRPEAGSVDSVASFMLDENDPCPKGLFPPTMI